jgi:dTDP-4-amino-4,6-dideoxygalactose transaminase
MVSDVKPPELPIGGAQRRIYYGQAVYGEAEISAANAVLRDQPLQLMDGPAVKRFESQVATLFDKQRGLMVNSGSSALTLAIAALQLPPGSEVITPALNWATTVAPLLQHDLTPVFVDVEADTFVIDAAGIEQMIGPHTRAMLIPDLIGNAPQWDVLADIARRHGLRTVHDSADTIGGSYQGRGTGAFSDITITSFYASHIITCAGFGGMLCCNAPELLERAMLLRGWGRRSSLFHDAEDLDSRFSEEIDGEPYDGKFIFDAPGYNFLPSEFAAAFGLEQLKRLPAFIETRRSNFTELYKFFGAYRDILVLPRQHSAAHTPWLAFPLIVRPEAPFGRLSLQQYLERRGIQTRPIFTGNILRHPGFSDMRCRVAAAGYPNADAVMHGGLLIGCHQGMDADDVQYVKQAFTDFAAQAGIDHPVAVDAPVLTHLASPPG